MSTLDKATEHFNNGKFILSIGVIDEVLYNPNIGTLLELKIHNLVELDSMDEALKTVEILNDIDERYHYKMLHLHVLNMMERYYDAYNLLQQIDQQYGTNIGLNRLLLRLIP